MHPVQAPPTLFGMMLAAIVVIAAMVMSPSASAHVGHHGPRHVAADPARPVSGAITDDVADEHAAALPPALAISADPTPDGGPACPGPCCCLGGGMGCASPALGPPPPSPAGPTVAWAAKSIAPSSHPPDALRERLRKPPRA